MCSCDTLRPESPSIFLSRKIEVDSQCTVVKDVYTKMFQPIDFLKFLLNSDNELLV